VVSGRILAIVTVISLTLPKTSCRMTYRHSLLWHFWSHQYQNNWSRFYTWSHNLGTSCLYCIN